MLNKIYKIGFVSAVIASPFFAYAEALGGTTTFFANALGLVKGVLIPLVFTLGLLFFFWGVVKYIWSEGQGKEDGRKIMIWGVVALFVMSTIWGIIYFIGQEIGGGVGDQYDMHIPTIE
jgi:hypothetical protein